MFVNNESGQIDIISETSGTKVGNMTFEIKGQFPVTGLVDTFYFDFTIGCNSLSFVVPPDFEVVYQLG